MIAPEVVTVLPLFEDATRSVARIALNGMNIPVRNTICRLRYEVVCGDGVMIVGGVLHELHPGVVVNVEPGQAYQDAGKLSMVATSEPPFYPEQVEAAEQQLPMRFSVELTQASQLA